MRGLGWLVGVCLTAAVAGADDGRSPAPSWPRWRGPLANGFVPAGELADLKGNLSKLPDLETIAPVMDRLPRAHDG